MSGALTNELVDLLTRDQAGKFETKTLLKIGTEGAHDAMLSCVLSWTGQVCATSERGANLSRTRDGEEQWCKAVCAEVIYCHLSK